MRILLYILTAMVVTLGAYAANDRPAAAPQTQNAKVEVPERKKANSREQNKQEVPPPRGKDAKDVKENKGEKGTEEKTESPKAATQPQQDQPQQGKVEKPEVEVNMQYDGIDVSRHQKTINWDAIAADKKVKYVYIKATEGQSFVDPKYRENIENARRVGLKVGSYHFLRTGIGIQEQFDNFVRNVKKGEQDLLPLLDVEVRQGWSNQQLRDSVKLFVDMLENHYGCKPMIYTSSSFFNTILGRLFADYPLFIARYATNEPKLENGATWTLWQFSDRGRIRGIDHAVDLSRFNKGKALRDIMIKDNKLGQQKRRNADVVDKSREKPAAVTVKKEAPTRSKQQEAEIKKKQDKEQKTRERAEKLARDEEAKKETQPQTDRTNVRKAVRQRTNTTPVDPEEAKKALEKERKEQEKAAKAAAKAEAARQKAIREQEAREKAAREKAEKEAQKRVDKMVKEEIKKQEKEEAEAEQQKAALEAEKQAKEHAEKQAREKAEKEAEKQAKEQAEKQAREQEKQAKEQEKKAKEQAKEAERLAQEQEKQAREAEKQAREEAKQKAIAEKRAAAQAAAQAELDQEAQAQAARNAQQQKRQQVKEMRQQQRAGTKTKSTDTPTRKRVNKSTVDND